MIPIAVAFTVLVVLLVRQYGAYRPARYLTSLVLFWLASFTASILIIGNQSAFFLVGPRLLPMDWFLVRRVPTLVGWSRLLITVLNVSTAGFYYCFLAFSIVFSHPTGTRVRVLLWMLAIPPLLIAVAFDPLFVQYLSRLNATGLEHRFVSLVSVYRVARITGRVVFFLYLTIGIGTLMIYCWDRPRSRRIQRTITYMAVASSVFATMFAFFFYRSPQLLVVPTFRDPFARIGFYEIPTSIQLLRVYTVTQIAVILFLAFSVARFLRLASTDSFQDTRIRHTLRAASLGSRVMGHAVKNQLFAIESELNSLRSELPEGQAELASRLGELARMCSETYKSVGQTIEMLRVPALQLTRSNLVVDVQVAASKWNQSCIEADVSFSADSDEAPAYADPSHFQEVIINLLNNAQQASRDSDSTRILIEVIVDNFWIYLQITDNGAGIDPATSEHLFDPFYTENRGSANWGVGLTYCRSIIGGHDGSIEIRNANGGGAQVEISIPRAHRWR